MRIVTEWNEVPPEPHVVTIGNFDGVHRGHRHLLETVRYHAIQNGVASLVITFDPLPAEVLVPDRAPLRLTLTEQRLRLLLTCGIDRILLIRFDHQFASLTPREFISVLARATHPTEIVVGDDFHFGRGRSGNPEVLRELASEFGFTVSVIPKVDDGSTPISSTRIRQAITEGNVSLAAELLGRPHALVGEIIAGSGRGSQLGFPTANLAVLDRLLPPAHGIYTAVVWARETWYPALAYIGDRPTFPGAGYAVETYLLAEPVPNLRGEILTIYFIDRLRPDRAFSSVQELVAQMHQDEQQARKRLESLMSSWPPPLVAALHTPLEGVHSTHGSPERA